MARRREHAALLAHRRRLRTRRFKPFRRTASTFRRNGRRHSFKSFLAFSHGRIVSDNAHAPGIEIGRASDTYRRIRISSVFGVMAVFVTDGHLPYPYGREMTGYEVANLAGTIDKAKTAGVSILDGPFSADGRKSAMVQFPGGYIAEIHSTATEK